MKGTNTLQLGSTTITNTNNNGAYRLVVDNRDLHKQIEKTVRPLQQFKQVFDFLEENTYFSKIYRLSEFFQIVSETIVKI